MPINVDSKAKWVSAIRLIFVCPARVLSLVIFVDVDAGVHDAKSGLHQYFFVRNCTKRDPLKVALA